MGIGYSSAITGPKYARTQRFIPIAKPISVPGIPPISNPTISRDSVAAAFVASSPLLAYATKFAAIALGGGNSPGFRNFVDTAICHSRISDSGAAIFSQRKPVTAAAPRCARRARRSAVRRGSSPRRAGAGNRSG